MRAYGIIRILKNRHDRVIGTYESISYEPVSLESASPMFIILGLGVLLSTLIFIIEKVYFHIKSRKHKFLKSRTNYWKPLIRASK